MSTQGTRPRYGPLAERNKGNMADTTTTIHTDVAIVGAGPAGIFTALGLIGKGDTRSITIVEKGLPVEKRSCPKA